MRASTNNTVFAPFDLVLHIETEEDARAIYAMFNHSDSSAVFPDEVSQGVIQKLDEHGNFYVSVEEEIANGVTYDEYYGSKG